MANLSEQRPELTNLFKTGLKKRLKGKYTKAKWIS
jgi:hypothetical protein